MEVALPSRVMHGVPHRWVTQVMGGWKQSAVSEADDSGSAPLEAFSDEALVAVIVRRNSPQHFRMLVARYKNRIHHIALSVLGPSRSADAEDVTQEVFISLYQKLASFRGDSGFATWLYRMAFNQAIDQQRREKKHAAEGLENVPDAGSEASGEASASARERANMVQKAVMQLPRTQQVIVHLHYWLGYRTREISELLGCPENTVKVYLMRARRALAARQGIKSHA